MAVPGGKLIFGVSRSSSSKLIMTSRNFVFTVTYHIETQVSQHSARFVVRL